LSFDYFQNCNIVASDFSPLWFVYAKMRRL
jgi:hypothetical protein